MPTEPEYRKKAKKRFQASNAAQDFTSRLARKQGSAIDLGERANQSKDNPRAGQKFREVVSNGKSYHVYEKDGKREVVAVKTKGTHVLPRLRQMQSVGPMAAKTAAPRVGSAMPMTSRSTGSRMGPTKPNQAMVEALKKRREAAFNGDAEFDRSQPKIPGRRKPKFTPGRKVRAGYNPSLRRS